MDARNGELTIAAALEESGVAVERLTLRTPTLDDVFLEVTGNHMRADEEDDR